MNTISIHKKKQKEFNLLKKTKENLTFRHNNKEDIQNLKQKITDFNQEVKLNLQPIIDKKQISSQDIDKSLDYMWISQEYILNYHFFNEIVADLNLNEIIQILSMILIQKKDQTQKVIVKEILDYLCNIYYFSQLSQGIQIQESLFKAFQMYINDDVESYETILLIIGNILINQQQYWVFVQQYEIDRLLLEGLSLYQQNVQLYAEIMWFAQVLLRAQMQEFLPFVYEVVVIAKSLIINSRENETFLIESLKCLIYVTDNINLIDKNVELVLEQLYQRSLIEKLIQVSLKRYAVSLDLCGILFYNLSTIIIPMQEYVRSNKNIDFLYDLLIVDDVDFVKKIIKSIWNMLKSETIINFIDIKKIIKLLYENYIKFESYQFQKKISELVKDFLYSFKKDQEKTQQILNEFLCKETLYLALKNSHLYWKLNVIFIFNFFDSINRFYQQKNVCIIKKEQLEEVISILNNYFENGVQDQYTEELHIVYNSLLDILNNQV